MERYSIAERQAIKDRLADEKYFDRDRALFASLFPHHALLPELARANNVNRLSLCRRMIYNLLTKVSEADIVAARSETTVQTAGKHEGTTKELRRNYEEVDRRTITGSSAEKKPGKAEEFPGINWTDNTNPDIQLCILLYDERVNTWHQMVALRADIDDCPEKAVMIAELDDRNRMAQNELEVYQDTHVFPCKHPIATQFLEERATMDKYRTLRRTDIAKFMKQISNIRHNITRIRATLKKKDLSPDVRSRQEANLTHALRLEELMQRVLEE